MLSECYLNENNLIHGRVMARTLKFSPQIFGTRYKLDINNNFILGEISQILCH